MQISFFFRVQIKACQWLLILFCFTSAFFFLLAISLLPPAFLFHATPPAQKKIGDFIDHMKTFTLTPQSPFQTCLGLHKQNGRN
jgi:hypothetical protein